MTQKPDAFSASHQPTFQTFIDKEVNIIPTNSLSYQPASSINLTQSALTCPNCGSALEGRKCKLFCPRPGCGYLVTCSEW